MLLICQQYLPRLLDGEVLTESEAANLRVNGM